MSEASSPVLYSLAVLSPSQQARERLEADGWVRLESHGSTVAKYAKITRDVMLTMEYATKLLAGGGTLLEFSCRFQGTSEGTF